MFRNSIKIRFYVLENGVVEAKNDKNSFYTFKVKKKNDMPFDDIEEPNTVKINYVNVKIDSLSVLLLRWIMDN